MLVWVGGLRSILSVVILWSVSSCPWSVWTFLAIRLMWSRRFIVIVTNTSRFGIILYTAVWFQVRPELLKSTVPSYIYVLLSCSPYVCTKTALPRLRAEQCEIFISTSDTVGTLCMIYGPTFITSGSLPRGFNWVAHTRPSLSRHDAISSAVSRNNLSVMSAWINLNIHHSRLDPCACAR